MILNVYQPNSKDLEFKKQKLIEMKGEVDKSTIIVGDFNTTPLASDRTTTQNQQV